jgi:hypothetical protein
MLVKVNLLFILFVASVGCSLSLAAADEAAKKAAQDANLAVNKQEAAKPSSIDVILNLLKLQRENIKKELVNLIEGKQRTKRLLEGHKQKIKTKCHKIRECKDGVCTKRRACHTVVKPAKAKAPKVPKHAKVPKEHKSHTVHVHEETKANKTHKVHVHDEPKTHHKTKDIHIQETAKTTV